MVFFELSGARAKPYCPGRYRTSISYEKLSDGTRCTGR